MPARSKAPGTLPTPSQAYPPPPAPPVAPAATAPAPPASWPPPAANSPAPAGVPPPPGNPPAGYPPAPGYPPPGYANPGYPPPYGYPPPGYGYPTSPPYPNGYYPYVAPARRPGAHLHDGLYLNMATGLGGFGFTIDSAGTKTEISGAAVPFELALGGALTPHLILFGAFYGVSSTDSPTFKVGGKSTTSSGTVGLLGIGPGVAYYFGESNYFLSGVLAFSQLDFSSFNSLPRTSDQTNWGLTFTLTAGREWWVSDNWALGLAAQLMAGSMKDDHFINNMDPATTTSPSWSAGVFSLLFSASYN